MNVIVKKTVLIALLLIAAIAYFMLSKKPQQQTTVGQLIVGTNAQFPPFEFIKDGNYEGFDIDLIKEIGKRMHKEIVIKDVAYDTLLLEAQSGQVHIIAAGMTPTAERAQKILFTKPYVGNDDSLVAVMRAPHTIAQFEDLYGKNVIVCDGFTAETQMKKHEQIHVNTLATNAECFLALNSGRAFAFVTAQNTLQPFFEKYGKEKYTVFSLDMFEPSALGVSKMHAHLLEPLQKILDELEHDGTLQKLKTKWNVN